MIFIYNLIFSLFTLIYFPYLIIKGKWHDGFYSRLGLFSKELEEDFALLAPTKNFWFHAVSVGEILAIIGLVHEIKARFPQHRIVLSTVTKTGYALANSKFTKDITVIYAPLDFSWIVKKFIQRVHPVAYITAETEIWPNLFLALRQKGIPIVQVNGRISDQSYRRYKFVQGLLKPVLNCVQVFCMQSAMDADRIKSLGASVDRVHVVGNIKFDEVPNALGYQTTDLEWEKDTLVWVAGSTHPGEEKVILEIFQKLKLEFFSLRVVIAPRHIQRADEIIALATNDGFSAAKFSAVMKRERPAEQITVIVVDTIGHLRSLYNLAAVVFIGKSLVGHGGQNIIEPAFFGKAILAGPHMENFKGVMSAFLENQAVIQVQDADELFKKIRELLQNPELRIQLGQRAKLTIEKYQGATMKTQEMISSSIMETTEGFRQ